MKKTNEKNKKNIKESLKLTTLAFTLVELLAVIVILAIILVIAVPKIMSVIEDAKKATLESTAKMIASHAEKQKVQNTLLGKIDEITCDSVTKINNVDYADCDIIFEDNIAKVTIEGSGKFEGLYVCDGTKTEAVSQSEKCDLLDNDNNDEDEDDSSSDSTEPSDTSLPVITIDQELGTSSDSPLIIGSSSYTVSGTVSDESGIASLTVNDADVTVGENGVWSTTLTLTQSVVTEVIVVAKDSKGNTSTENRYVKYGVESGYAYYNGLECPVLPLSGYQWIIRTNGLGTTELVGTDYDPAFTYFSSTGKISPTTTADTYIVKDGAWVDDGFLTIISNISIASIIWSSHDIYDNQGVLLFASSEPVIVYE